MHPAISINTLSLPPAAFDTQVERVTRLGARAISPGIEDIAAFGTSASVRRLRDIGLTVATLTHRAFAFSTMADADAARARLYATIEVATMIGARSITVTTGGRGDLSWQDAARRFAEAIMPAAERARAAGVVLALEPTSHLYADASIAHRLADTIDLAGRARIGVGIDLFACWTDADIEDAIAAAGPTAALVQVSDQVAGDRALPCRAVPGDGMIPLARLITLIVHTGFAGFWDIEVIGPRLAAEGHERGLARGADRLAGWIAAAGQGSGTSSAGGRVNKASRGGADGDASTFRNQPTTGRRQ